MLFLHGHQGKASAVFNGTVPTTGMFQYSGYLPNRKCPESLIRAPTAGLSVDIAAMRIAISSSSVFLSSLSQL